jgi:hypothetical protein
MKHWEIHTTAISELAWGNTFMNMLWLHYVVHEVVRNVAALPDSSPPCGKAWNFGKVNTKVTCGLKLMKVNRTVLLQSDSEGHGKLSVLEQRPSTIRNCKRTKS